MGVGYKKSWQKRERKLNGEHLQQLDTKDYVPYIDWVGGLEGKLFDSVNKSFILFMPNLKLFIVDLEHMITTPSYEYLSALTLLVIT